MTRIKRAFIMDYKFQDLVDVKSLQILSDSFSKLTKIVTAILETDGEVLTASGWQRICTEFHRKNPQTAERCTESDTTLAERATQGSKYNWYNCKNGLVDVAVPIMIENKHYATLFTGQFFFEPPGRDFFCRQADEFGFDKAAYLDALSEVPVFTKEDIENAMEFLVDFAKLLAEMGLKQKKLLNVSEELEKKVEERTEELFKAKEKAEKATQLKNQFISLVSHDLRSPFISIQGFTKFILDDKDHPLHPRHREIMERINENTGKMLTMIEELLQISRLQTGKIIPKSIFIDGHKAVSFAMGHLSHLAKEKGIEIINNVPAGTRLFADPHLFGQVLLNIASNAVKFCKEGDRIAFFVPEGKATTIALQDTGVGMQGDFLAKIFSHEDKTSTAGTKGERGTGLGLPLSHDIMKALGGNLCAESKKGEGSVFYAELPYRKPQVLVVDDEEHSKFLIKTLLRNCDLEIKESRNREETLGLVDANDFHLIITELLMDEFELIKTVRENPKTSSIPVIAITSDQKLKTREQALRMGANDFISKPLTEEDFLPRVRRFVI